MNDARTPRSRRGNVSLGSPSSLQPGGAKGRPVPSRALLRRCVGLGEGAGGGGDEQ